MSTILTLDEAKAKYPKFYQSPHLWIGAIEVERIKGYINPFQPKKEAPIWMEVGGRYKLNVVTVLCMNERDLWENYIPLFKPQEGEQFIKDLTEAVRAGCYGEPVIKTLETKWDWTFTLKNDDEASITVVKSGLDVSLSHGVTFNTAAYVDKLRELGYYL